MNTPLSFRLLSRHLLAAALVAGAVSGCSTLISRPATSLTAKHDEPGVVLCMSERTGSGGIRIIGKLETGVFPITKATIQYRTAGPSDAVPAEPAGTQLELVGARSEKVPYRKGTDEVVFTIDADAARSLRGKVLWYRWLIEYDRNGSPFTNRTDIYRTSIEEAGLPRSPGTPGPDSSVALPTTHRR